MAVTDLESILTTMATPLFILESVIHRRHEMHFELTQSEQISFLGGWTCFVLASNGGQKRSDKTESASEVEFRVFGGYILDSVSLLSIQRELTICAKSLFFCQRMGNQSSLAVLELLNSLHRARKPWKQKMQLQSCSQVHRR